MHVVVDLHVYKSSHDFTPLGKYNPSLQNFPKWIGIGLEFFVSLKVLFGSWLQLNVFNIIKRILTILKHYMPVLSRSTRSISAHHIFYFLAGNLNQIFFISS